MTSTHLTDRVAALIAPLLPAQSAILIGLSGGVDSVVLLHLLHRLAPRFSWRLSALHVHHGISPNADSWADFCTKLCTQYRIPSHIEQVDIAPLRAQGIEAAARQLRHAALAAQPCHFVALAHHADDQAETLLLQLLRGAGVRGASAMPVLSKAEGSVLSTSKGRDSQPNIVRPLLHCSRQEILDYAARHQLQWIEDESNADDSYPRNFLRHHVLPLLAEKFPAYRDTLVRSTQHFAEAGGLLDELAQQDAGSAMQAGTLAVAALQALSQPRAKNLLRYFLRCHGAPMPQAVQLDDMLQQLCSARQDAAVCIAYGVGETLLRSNRLREQPPAAPPAPEGYAPVCQGSHWQVRRYRGSVHVLLAQGEFDRNEVLPWRGEAELDWPALNIRLRFNRTRQHAPGAAISLVKLQRAPVTLRLRQGGEALRLHPNAPTRTLKNLLQEHHVPPWQRDRLPLLYCGDDLVCVLGVAIAETYQAVAEEAAMQIACAKR